MRLEQKMNLKLVQMQDPVFRWYYNTVMPKIWGCVKSEKDSESYFALTLTRMLFEALHKIDRFDDQVELKYEDWDNFMRILSNYSIRYPLSELTFNNIPEMLPEDTGMKFRVEGSNGYNYIAHCLNDGIIKMYRMGINKQEYETVWGKVDQEDDKSVKKYWFKSKDNVYQRINDPNDEDSWHLNIKFEQNSAILYKLVFVNKEFRGGIEIIE